ncbi:MAG: YbhN family protein [Anaeroplasmataceae bacterium]
METQNEDLNKKKKSTIKYVLSFLFLALLVIVTFAIIFTKYDVKNLYAVMKRININYVLIGVILMFIYIFFESCATKTILSALGVKSSLFHNIEYSSIDYYFCAITPSAAGGQPMVLYYMAKDGISIPNGSITLLLNTAFFKIVLIVLTIFSIFFAKTLILESTLLVILLIIGVVINLVVITVCFLGSFKNEWIDKIGKRLIMWLGKIKLVKRPMELFRVFSKKMKEYEMGAKLIKQNKLKFMLALIFNLIQRVAMFSMAYFVYLAFVDTYPSLGGYSYFELFAIQVIIAMSVDSLPLPGGMGISEYLYVSIFESIYIAENCVASAMLLTRALNFYIPLILTALLVFIKHIRILIKDKKNGEKV